MLLNYGHNSYIRSIMSKNLVIIPTYNEIENIEKMIRKVFSLSTTFNLLIVSLMMFFKIKENLIYIKNIIMFSTHNKN